MSNASEPLNLPGNAAPCCENLVNLMSYGAAKRTQPRIRGHGRPGLKWHPFLTGPLPESYRVRGMGAAGGSSQSSWRNGLGRKSMHLLDLMMAPSLFRKLEMSRF